MAVFALLCVSFEFSISVYERHVAITIIILRSCRLYELYTRIGIANFTHELVQRTLHMIFFTHDFEVRTLHTNEMFIRIFV